MAQKVGDVERMAQKGRGRRENGTKKVGGRTGSHPLGHRLSWKHVDRREIGHRVSGNRREIGHRVSGNRREIGHRGSGTNRDTPIRRMGQVGYPWGHTRHQRANRGFQTRTVCLYYISCLRYTSLAGNSRNAP